MDAATIDEFDFGESFDRPTRFVIPVQVLIVGMEPVITFYCHVEIVLLIVGNRITKSIAGSNVLPERGKFPGPRAGCAVIPEYCR